MTLAEVLDDVGSKSLTLTHATWSYKSWSTLALKARMMGQCCHRLKYRSHERRPLSCPGTVPGTLEEYTSACMYLGGRTSVGSASMLPLPSTVLYS